MRPRVWIGEALRWYLKRARHPLKDYIVGHYWGWFSRRRVWIRYDTTSVINVRLGDYLQQQIFFEEYYERSLIDWLKQTLGPTDVFWDVGANIGAVTLVAARLCARVVAFEPDPRSLRLLEANIRANRLANVEIVPKALGLAAGTAPLYQASDLNIGMTSLLSGRGATAGEAEVSVIRADDLVETHAHLAPTIMKIDVEGAEHLVLGGATRTLGSGRVRAIVFEDGYDEHAMPVNAAVMAILRADGYDVEPFGTSDAHAADGMCNFLATPTGWREAPKSSGHTKTP